MKRCLSTSPARWRLPRSCRWSADGSQPLPNRAGHGHQRAVSGTNRANFFKNAPGYTPARTWASRRTRRATSTSPRANETRLFEYAPDGKFVREIGRNNYGFAFAHAVRVTRRTHSGG